MLILIILFFISMAFDATTTIIGIQKYGFAEVNRFACWYHKWRHGDKAGDKGQYPTAYYTIELSIVQFAIVLCIVFLFNIISGSGITILIIAILAECGYGIFNTLAITGRDKK